MVQETYRTACLIYHVVTYYYKQLYWSDILTYILQAVLLIYYYNSPDGAYRVREVADNKQYTFTQQHYDTTVL